MWLRLDPAVVQKCGRKEDYTHESPNALLILRGEGREQGILYVICAEKWIAKTLL